MPSTKNSKGMKTGQIIILIALFSAFGGCSKDESTQVNLDNNFTGFWFKQNQHHKLIADTQGYIWGFRIQKNGDVTMARLTSSTGQIDIEANGALFKISNASDGVFNGSNENEKISGTYSIDTTLLSEKYHPRLSFYSAMLTDEYLPGGSAGDWSINGYYAKVLDEDNTDPIIPAPIELPASLGVGMVAYYPFNGNANDESGNNNNGTVSGAILTKDRSGNDNRAYSFSRASKNKISVPHNSSLNLNNFCISAWIKPTLTSSATDGARFIDKGIWGDPNCTNYSLAFIEDGRIRIWYEYGSGTNVTSYSKSTCALNSWSHVVFSYNAIDKKISIYIRGTLDNTRENSNVPSFNSDELVIGGALGTDVTTLNFFNGDIDNIRIYNRILTEKEIMALFVANE